MTARISYDQSQLRLDWVADRVGPGVNFAQPAKVLLSVDDQTHEFLGGVVYNHFTPGNCEVHVVAESPRFANRHTIREFFAYPFLQLGLNRLTGIVHTSNRRSLEGAQRLGFRVEGLLRDWYGKDQHGILLGMTREECKWV